MQRSLWKGVKDTYFVSAMTQDASRDRRALKGNSSDTWKCVIWIPYLSHDSLSCVNIRVFAISNISVEWKVAIEKDAVVSSKGDSGGSSTSIEANAQVFVKRTLVQDTYIVSPMTQDVSLSEINVLQKEIRAILGNVSLEFLTCLKTQLIVCQYSRITPLQVILLYIE